MCCDSATSPGQIDALEAINGHRRRALHLASPT
jgi:hypothetical protein